MEKHNRIQNAQTPPDIFVHDPVSFTVRDYVFNPKRTYLFANKLTTLRCFWYYLKTTCFSRNMSLPRKILRRLYVKLMIQVCRACTVRVNAVHDRPGNNCINSRFVYYNDYTLNIDRCEPSLYFCIVFLWNFTRPQPLKCAAIMYTLISLDTNCTMFM